MTLKGAVMAKQQEIKNDDWNPVTNPAVKELLDHLAQELATEYVRLMDEGQRSATLAGPHGADTKSGRDSS